MTTFAEQLKTLSVPELEKLKRILMLLAQDANHGFDALLEQIRAPKSALSQSDADLIDSRTYELEIYNHLDAASAHKQAMLEFESGNYPSRQRRHSRDRWRHPAIGDGGCAYSTGAAGRFSTGLRFRHSHLHLSQRCHSSGPLRPATIN